MLYKEALDLSKANEKLTSLSDDLQKRLKYPYLNLAEQSEIDSMSRVGSTGVGLLAGGLLGSLVGLVHGATSKTNKLRKSLRHGLYGGLLGSVIGSAGGFGASYPIAEGMKGTFNEQKRRSSIIGSLRG